MAFLTPGSRRFEGFGSPPLSIPQFSNLSSYSEPLRLRGALLTSPQAVTLFSFRCHFLCFFGPAFLVKLVIPPPLFPFFGFHPILGDLQRTENFLFCISSLLPPLHLQSLLRRQVVGQLLFRFPATVRKFSARDFSCLVHPHLFFLPQPRSTCLNKPWKHVPPFPPLYSPPMMIELPTRQSSSISNKHRTSSGPSNFPGTPKSTQVSSPQESSPNLYFGLFPTWWRNMSGVIPPNAAGSLLVLSARR